MDEMNILPNNTYNLFTDGGSRGNPGKSACAWVLYDESKNIVYSKYLFLGNATNNYAEYKGLINGLTSVLELGVENVKCFADSELMVKQVKGIYKIKEPSIKILFDELKPLIAKFKCFSISHVERAKNKEADRLVNVCLDQS